MAMRTRRRQGEKEVEDEELYDAEDGGYPPSAAEDISRGKGNYHSAGNIRGY